MKKALSLLLIFCILWTFPFYAAAQQDEEYPDWEDTEDPADQEPEEQPEVEPQEPLQPEQPTDPDPYAYELILPDKLFYLVGQEPDFTGGEFVYTNANRRISLTSRNCTGLDTSTPGNKYVRVMVGKIKTYFRVVVLAKENPIVAMKDIAAAHWSYNAFSLCMKAGYFAGNDQKKIMPDKPITRAEMATLIYEAWKKDPTVMVTNSPHAAPAFSDVAKGSWYYTAVEACRKAGIIQGTDKGECMPEAPITRQDAVLMLMRIQYGQDTLKQLDVDSLLAASGIPALDFDQTADYAKAAVAVALGTVIQGNEKGEVMPRASITRAECAVIFKQLFLKDYQPIPTDDGPLIYLSPSNQFTNPYAGIKANEGEEMNKIATAAKALLEAKGYRVFIADRKTSIYDRSGEANEMGADIYVPIHSNAGGGVGTRVFYRGDREGSTKLGRYLFDSLAALTNTPFNERNYKEDYVCLMPDGAPFHELANPNMPVAYLEVEFHDIPEKAIWITQNIDALAEAIANGIDAYCKNEMTEVSTLEHSNQKTA